MTIAIFFILGLIIGSFLNVAVYRIREADTVLGRSYCPHCKKGIRWYDNIPVLSFILLRAQCRDCKEKISAVYPLVEIFTAIVFAAVSWKFLVPSDATSWLTVFYYLAASSVLIVILAYDALHFEIPGLVLWPMIGASVAYNLAIDWQRFGLETGILGSATYSGTLAAFLAFLFFFLLSSLSREKWMGMGDAYLVILLGLILGVPEIFLALFLAFAIGAVYGIILIAAGKKKMKSRVPFAPFLILGTLIGLLFYGPITGWYIGLISF